MVRASIVPVHVIGWEESGCRAILVGEQVIVEQLVGEQVANGSSVEGSKWL